MQEDRKMRVQISDAYSERSSRFHPFRNSADNSGSDSTMDAGLTGSAYRRTAVIVSKFAAEETGVPSTRANWRY